jgi:hypothetical protein
MRLRQAERNDKGMTRLHVHTKKEVKSSPGPTSHAFMQTPGPPHLTSALPESPVTPHPQPEDEQAEQRVKTTASREYGRNAMLPAMAGCCGDEACVPGSLGYSPPHFRRLHLVLVSGCQAAAGPAPSLEQSGGARSVWKAWFTLGREDG